MPSRDTDPRADAFQIELLRRAGTARRAALCLSLSDWAIAASRSALAHTMHGATALEVRLRWVELHYGNELGARVRAYLAATAR